MEVAQGLPLRRNPFRPEATHIAAAAAADSRSKPELKT